MRGTKAIFSHKKTDYITPQELFQPIKEAFNIQLDPCAHDDHILDVDIKSIKKDKNGLLSEWDANTFINPPYSDIGIWVEKAIEQSNKYPKNFYALLLPSRTDRPWFKKLISSARAVCFMGKRIKFANASNNAPFPSILAVISSEGEFTNKQIELLEDLGCVI